ncbi:MAG TPA: hypothetical protein PLI17_12390 [Denitromonas sp.]|nr:hypothetical protein [Xanthomonadales bacterium]HPF73548.1 hypothetical protein [Xanthomonadaceae bacterium]HPR07422.1 hypothetical protein [Denitromonas sp.]HRX99420.1 hypothetical protein [Xanthomonadaceae bacterium]
MRSVLLFALLAPPCALAQDASFFSVPGQDWGLRFESSLVKSHKGASNGAEFQLQIETTGGLYATVFVEPAEGKGVDSQECKEFYWASAQKNPRIDSDTIQSAPSGDFVKVSYIVRAELNGMSIVQPNANYYGHRSGKCIDVHVSQPFLKGDPVDYTNLKLFEATLKYASVP